MNTAVIIIIIVTCFCISISSSVGAGIYMVYNSPSPSPSPEKETQSQDQSQDQTLKTSGEMCSQDSECSDDLKCVVTERHGDPKCYSISECRDKIKFNQYYAHDEKCGKSGCMEQGTHISNYSPGAEFEIEGECVTKDICKMVQDVNLLDMLAYSGVSCSEIDENLSETHSTAKILCDALGDGTFAEDIYTTLNESYNCDPNSD